MVLLAYGDGFGDRLWAWDGIWGGREVRGFVERLAVGVSGVRFEVMDCRGGTVLRGE